MRKLALAFALALVAASARADQPPVDQYPAFLKPYVAESEKPLGQAVLKWTWFKVYDIALWSSEKEWSYNSAFAIHVRYARGFTGDELVESTLKEINFAKEMSPQEEDNARAELLALMPDVEEGDTITAVHVPGQFLTLYHNGKQAGRITDRILAKRFLNIWLGKKTSHPEIGLALKGKAQ